MKIPGIDQIFRVTEEHGVDAHETGRSSEGAAVQK
jgi:hypothetical protein